MNSLNVDQLSFERDDIYLFRNLSATWRSGEIVQLAGRNGSGKTTLMKILAGLLHPSAGKVTWNGSSVKTYDYKSSLLYLGHLVGVKATMTPLENLNWYFSLNGLKSSRGASYSGSDIELALDRIGLHTYENVPCYQLSAGQQRRVALARLYLSEAPIWILDEPFTAIDKSGVAELEGIIEMHTHRGGIVILSTHQAWKSASVRVLDLEAFKQETDAPDD